MRVVRVNSIFNVEWELVGAETLKTGTLHVSNWLRRYRPFTTPPTGTPTASADEQEK